MNDDHSQYPLLFGRQTAITSDVSLVGQQIYGSNATTYPGIRNGLYLQGWGTFSTGSDGAARLDVERNITARCDNFLVCERDSTLTVGFSIATSLTGATITHDGRYTLQNTDANGLTIDLVNATGGAAVYGLKVKKAAGTNAAAKLLDFQTSAAASMSSVRASDGAWVGPVVASGTDSHIDSAFQILGSSDATKIAMFEVDGFTTATTRTFTLPDATGTLALLGLAQTWGALQKFPDNMFQVVGSADATKIVAFEADGLTTGTTRTLTAPDVSGLLLVGGAGIVNTIDAANSLAAVTLTTNLVPLTGAASGTLSLLSVLVSGTAGYSSGTPQIRGLSFTPNWSASANYTPTALIGVITDTSFGTGTGTITALYGALFRNRRSASSGPVINDIVGVGSSPCNMTNTNGGVAIPTFRAFLALRSTLTTAVTYGGGTVTDAIAYDIDSTFAASSSFLTWSGLRIPSISGPGTIWGLNITGTMNNQIAGKLALGGAATPSHMLDLAAGTTTVAQIRMAASTLLTTAVAGCKEYDGTGFFLTHSDAVRTLAVTQRGKADLTAQAAAIGATTIYTPPAAGYYLVHYTLEDTAADLTAGTIQFQVNYTDDIGATNQTGGALAMTAVGRDRGSFQVYSASGVISYQTNLTGIFGTAQYALRVRIVHLG